VGGEGVSLLAFGTPFKRLNLGSASHNGEDSSAGDAPPEMDACAHKGTELESKSFLLNRAGHGKFCGSRDLLRFSPD